MKESNVHLSSSSQSSLTEICKFSIMDSTWFVFCTRRSQTELLSRVVNGHLLKCFRRSAGHSTHTDPRVAAFMSSITCLNQEVCGVALKPEVPQASPLPPKPSSNSSSPPSSSQAKLPATLELTVGQFQSASDEPSPLPIPWPYILVHTKSERLRFTDNIPRFAITGIASSLVLCHPLIRKQSCGTLLTKVGCRRNGPFTART